MKNTLTFLSRTRKKDKKKKIYVCTHLITFYNLVWMMSRTESFCLLPFSIRLLSFLCQPIKTSVYVLSVKHSVHCDLWMISSRKNKIKKNRIYRKWGKVISWNMIKGKVLLKWLFIWVFRDIAEQWKNKDMI